MTQIKIMTRKGKMLTFYYISVLTTNFQTKPFQKPQHSHSPKAVKILWKNIHMGKFYSRNSFLAIFAMFTFVADIYEHVHLLVPPKIPNNPKKSRKISKNPKTS